MANITDPTDAMTDFEKAFRLGELSSQKGDLDPSVIVHADTPQGIPRMTYVKMDGKNVTEFVTFVLSDPYEGLPCFQIGYAVPAAYRRQGRGRAIVDIAIAEMIKGFARSGVNEFYVEAIVGESNLASKRIAELTISHNSKSIVDGISGVPARQYFRKVIAAR